MAAKSTCGADEARFRFRGLRGALAFGLISGGVQAGQGLRALRRAQRKSAGALALARPVLNIGMGTALAAAAISARDGGVRITDHGVVVDLGWYWRGTIPYTEISGVEEGRNALWAGLGVRTDFRTFLALVLWGRHVTTLIFDPPRRLPLNPILSRFTVPLRQLRLGIEDGEGFRTALERRLTAPTPPLA